MLRTCVVRLRGEQVDVIGEVLPRAGNARHHGLAAETAFGADLARDARHLGGERAQLIHHRVDGFLQLQDLAAHVDGDLLRQVALGDGDRHLGDVAHLSGQVDGHRVDALGEVLPDARHLADLRLAAELAVGADLARDARHLGGEHRELLDHRIDDGRRAQELALQRASVDVEAHGLQKVALGDGANGARHFRGRPQKVVDQLIDRRLHAAPGAGSRADAHALLGLAFAADDLADAVELLRHAFVGGDDIVKSVGDFAPQAVPIARQPDGKIAPPHGAQDDEQVAQLGCFRRSVGVWGNDRLRVRLVTHGIEQFVFH